VSETKTPQSRITRPTHVTFTGNLGELVASYLLQKL